MKCSVIIVAGGKGTRFKSAILKPFALLQKVPLIVHGLTVFEACIKIDQIIIVGHPDFLPRFKKVAKGFKKVSAIVSGGATRADSVKCGIKALADSCRYVLVHDAARPLIHDAMVRRVAKALKTAPAVITGVPVKATIKEVNSRKMTVTRTLQRSRLWEVQTPQGFKRDVLVRAHEKSFQGEATDDAMLVERLGIKVQVVMGDYRNIKVTTPEDMLVAKAFI